MDVGSRVAHVWDITATRFQFHGFLKTDGSGHPYGIEDLEQDIVVGLKDGTRGVRSARVPNAARARSLEPCGT